VSVRVLRKEDSSARLVAIFQVADNEVEQVRGLVLQISWPESTFATKLPIVIMIDPVSVLKMESFPVPLAASVSEPLRDLKRNNFSARLDA